MKAILVAVLEVESGEAPGKKPFKDTFYMWKRISIPALPTVGQNFDLGMAWSLECDSDTLWCGPKVCNVSWLQVATSDSAIPHILLEEICVGCEGDWISYHEYDTNVEEPGKDVTPQQLSTWLTERFESQFEPIGWRKYDQESRIKAHYENNMVLYKKLVEEVI